MVSDLARDPMRPNTKLIRSRLVRLGDLPIRVRVGFKVRAVSYAFCGP